MKKFNDIEENSESQFNELGNKINEQKKQLTKEIEMVKKDQTEILELKNSINEEGIRDHWKQSRPGGKRIVELKDKNLETTQE